MLWEVLEYIGETLVVIGVVGEIFAEWKEPERKKLARISGIVLVIGLAISLAALIATNEEFNSRIADLNNRAAEANAKAAASDLDAASARKETKQLEKETQGLREKADEAELELARLTGPVHTIPVVRGVATPDLAQGLTQRVLLRADTHIAAPRLPPMPKGGSLTWTLFIDEDSVGSHQYTILFGPLKN